MLQPIRRIITGHNEHGKSIIISDGPSPNKLPLLETPALGLTDLWVTHSVPADNTIFSDAAARKVVLEPPRGGTIFRIVEFPPEKEVLGERYRKAVFDAMSASETMDGDSSRHPMMHKTNTVDYAIVVSGEIYAVLDEGETLMRQGDCLVQRGTNHAWSNRSDGPCLVAFVLVDTHLVPPATEPITAAAATTV